ncbi:MAG: acetolactate synthase [Phycisphaeraceae bacterium]|nr:acetolactate synthase [Phycisphaeraceae bacterium]
MTQSPAAEVAGGFQPPILTQFSVFLPNRCGMMLDLVGVFAGHALTLAGFSVVDSNDHSVVRLVTSNGELARRLLQRNNMSFSESEVLAVELDAGHTLSEVCRCMLAAEVSIHYAYPLLVHPRGRAAVVIQSDDITLSGQILRRKLFTLLAENDLGDNAPGSAPDSP